MSISTELSKVYFMISCSIPESHHFTIVRNELCFYIWKFNKRIINI